VVNINLLRKRSGYQEPNRYLELLQHIGVAASGTALIAAIAGYGALMIGRSVPAALALGTLGSVGMAVNTRLKD
jgi:hypothetical protein